MYIPNQFKKKWIRKYFNIDSDLPIHERYVQARLSKYFYNLRVQKYIDLHKSCDLTFDGFGGVAGIRLNMDYFFSREDVKRQLEASRRK